MTRLNEVERAALEDLFLGLPNDTILKRMIKQLKAFFNII